MHFSTSTQNIKNSSGLLVLAINEKDLSKKSTLLKDLTSILDLNIISLLSKHSFDWKKGSHDLIETYTHKKIRGVLIYSWSSSGQTDFDYLKQYRVLGSVIANKAKELKTNTATILSKNLDLSKSSAIVALQEGIRLSFYNFSYYKKSKPSTSILKNIIFCETSKKLESASLKLASLTSSATCLARDLVNLAPKECTPKFLVTTCRKIAKNSPLALKVYGIKDLKRLKANAILAVAAGSSEPSYLIKLSYKPRKKPKKIISLVGKGVTFDSGGLSIKPAGGMMTMKMDMAGAAAVIATMQAISKLKPAVEVRAYIPTTENLINGKAIKPGDIVTALNGKSIEILNTDAEGRLILADALSLASREKSDIIVDLATLTGAVVVALGNDYAGLYCTDEGLQNSLLKSASLASERLWPMPLAPEYEDHILSKIADIRNIGKPGAAGSISAALFLKHFVKDAKWAHLDIAGAAYTESPGEYLSYGGLGFGVRTLINFILAQ